MMEVDSLHLRSELASRAAISMHGWSSAIELTNIHIYLNTITNVLDWLHSRSIQAGQLKKRRTPMLKRETKKNASYFTDLRAKMTKRGHNIEGSRDKAAARSISGSCVSG